MGTTVNDLVVGMIAHADKDTHKRDPFTAPCPWDNQKFLEVQKDPTKKKIGVLKESPHLKVSDAVQRAMRVTERALIEHGYQIEYISFDDEIWRDSREIFLNIAANALSPSVIEELAREGEELLPQFNGLKFILRANRVIRFILDVFFKVSNQGRKYTQLNGLR